MRTRRVAIAVGLGLLLLAAAALRYGACDGPAAAPAPSSVEPPAPAPAEQVEAQRPAFVPKAAPVPSLRLLEATALEDPAALMGAFEGKVVSAAGGQGVGSAELTFERSGAAFAARADPQGAFALAPPSAGVYRLAAITAPGFLPFAPEWEDSPIALTAAPGRRIAGLTFFLTPAVDYVAQVVDPAGAPVARARVRRRDSGEAELALAPMPDEFVTDERGEAALHAPDGALFEASHPDFSPGRGRLDFAAQVSHRLVLRLSPKAAAPAAGGSIRGKVVDPQNAPFAGAKVSARFRATGHGGTGLQPEPVALSGPDGEFELSGLDPGRYELVARNEGFAPAQVDDVPAGARDVVLKLALGGRVRGTVRSRGSGAPVAAFTVALLRRAGPIERPRFAVLAVADPAGAYLITGVPAGSYAVVAAASGMAPSAEVPIEVAAPPSPDVVADVQVSVGGTLTGTVRDEVSKAPLPGAVVSCEGTLAGTAALPLLASARTDARGTFTLKGLAEGLRSVQVAAADHNGRIVSGLQVVEGVALGPLQIELSPVKKGEQPKLELFGIGAVLKASGDAMVVEQALPGGGAAEAGLLPGDGIVEIDGARAADLGFAGSIEKIRGPEGTTVRLRVRREAAAGLLELTVYRRRIRH
ncbi:MAG: carboxypeptidase regulatory-like domain-containing protein [Myxococcaceae bacterium]